MEPQLVIHTDNLRKTYREGLLRNRNIDALCGVSLQIHPGEVFGLLGPNGAGKTTLIKILLGIVRKSSGSASVLNHAAGSQASRTRVGYLPENLHVARHHTARTALHYYGSLSRLDSRTIKDRSEELLQVVGLANRSNESVKRFSKGMGQRLGLAQALLNDPDLLILDEPTDGLDPVGRSQVRDIIDELKGKGKTIFVNSHILQEVEMMCDRVAILARGHVRQVGTIDSLRDGGQEQITLEVKGISPDAIAIIEEQHNAEADKVGDRTIITLGGEGDQDKVDAIVDIIRDDGASLFKLHQDRSSLEEVFLSLVNAQHAESS